MKKNGGEVFKNGQKKMSIFLKGRGDFPDFFRQKPFVTQMVTNMKLRENICDCNFF